MQRLGLVEDYLIEHSIGYHLIMGYTSHRLKINDHLALAQLLLTLAESLRPYSAGLFEDLF